MRRPKPGEWLAERTDIVVAAEAVAELAGRAVDEATRTYRMCGHGLRLRCDDESYALRFADAFRHMLVEDPDAGENATDVVFLTRRSGPEGFPAALVPGEGRAYVFAHESVAPTQLFACMLLHGLLPVTDHLVIHASVVERDGKATAFLGRTHAGKTTLALALALEDGVSFLSDEYCPIRIADGEVDPFPRILGIRSWTRDLLVGRGALPAATPIGARGQLDVDPLALRGVSPGRRVPIGNVVVVAGEAGEEAPDDVRDLDVEFVSDDLLRDLRAVPGVRAVEPRLEIVGAGRLLRVHVEPDAKVTERLLEVCESHGMRWHGLLPAGARRPDFTGSPLLGALDPFRGLTEVVRHLVNRVPLKSELGDDSLPRLLDCTAAALGQARFFELRPGPLDATVRTILDEVL